MLMTVLSGMKSWCHKMWFQVGVAQVKNNINKFPPRYRFQLTNEGIELISRSKNLTAISIMQTEDMKGGRTSLPLAFTEQGIYIVRGETLMLDFELAKIYGYETRAFN